MSTEKGPLPLTRLILRVAHIVPIYLMETNIQMESQMERDVGMEWILIYPWGEGLSL